MERLLLAFAISAGAVFPAVASDKFVLIKGELRHNSFGWPI
jgi:hypothetical protein